MSPEEAAKIIENRYEEIGLEDDQPIDFPEKDMELIRALRLFAIHSVVVAYEEKDSDEVSESLPGGVLSLFALAYEAGKRSGS